MSNETKNYPLNWLDNLITKNSWAIITSIIGLTIFASNLNNQVKAVELKVSKLEDLITRVVVLEEKDKGIALDISEIKTDLKEIKGLIR